MYLANRFASNSPVLRSSIPLTEAQLIEKVPSIFADTKHNSRSDRYTYVPTIELLRALKKEGFEPFMACQCRTRDESRRDFTKHMVRLRHASQVASTEANEIILLNSHDGTSAYQMLVGRFRFVCQNGLVCGDVVGDIRTHHKGDIAENIIESAYTILEDFNAVDESVDSMKALRLSFDEQRAFASAAMQLKYDDEEKAPIESPQLLDTRRRDDVGSSLWLTFNTIQENLTKGGLRGRTVNGSRTRTRPVNGIDGNVKLNRALWTLAEEMNKLVSR